MNHSITALAALLLGIQSVSANLLPNPLLSSGKTVYGSSGLSNLTALTDGSLEAPLCAMTADSWVAMQVGSGYSELLILWTSNQYAGGNWSDSIPSVQRYRQNLTFPARYNIEVSSNSTNGGDGDWTLAESISGNVVVERGHKIAFTGKTWFRLKVVEGSFGLNELQVFDASAGANDSWFLLGTSITAMSEKYPATPTVASLVHNGNSSYTPAIVRGGVGGVNSSEVVASLSAYLDQSAPMHFWAIEMGTNDGYGGGVANLEFFKSNLQIMIDSCRQRGVEPIIARPPATDPAKANWQLDIAYAEAVDELATLNHLAPGPDLYAWFLAHPEGLSSDGVHPATDGSVAIRQLWANAINAAYAFDYPSANLSPVRKAIPTLPVHPFHFDLLGRVEHHP